TRRVVRPPCSIPGVATLRLAVRRVHLDQYPAAAGRWRIFLNRPVLGGAFPRFSVVRLGRAASSSPGLDRFFYGCAGSQRRAFLYLARDVLAQCGESRRGNAEQPEHAKKP